MENKYDNEFVRNQLYDIYGKSKGLSREEFSNELNDLVIVKIVILPMIESVQMNLII